MDIFLIADACEGLGPIVSVIKALFNIIKIFVPIALLIFGVIDLIFKLNFLLKKQMIYQKIF